MKTHTPTPTPAQRKILQAISDGKALERRQPLRANKPSYWTLDSRKIADASPDACRKNGWLEAISVTDGSPFKARWSVPFALTEAGRTALTRAQGVTEGGE
jgi:hypothetical protein